MRAAIFAAALSAAHAARECGGECPAVVYNHLEGRGSSISSSDAPGFLALSSCCENLVKSPTGTPGAGCGKFKDCQSCSLFSFCVWGKGTCVEEVNLEAEAGEYSHSCAGPGPENFIGAIMKPEVNKIVPSVVPPGTNFTESPHMALAPVDWPIPFDGFLPPAGCSHKGMTEIEFQERFPSGLPGCGMYITGGMGAKNKEGHTTTDIVSDPRLPSETNMAGYPLSANINLAAGDHLVGGGDWALPQPEAGWLEPNFNGNGCVGGPCDADDSATSLGIYGENGVAL